MPEMKQLRRWLFNLMAGISAMLCVMTAFLWWGSYQPKFSRSATHALEQGAAAVPNLTGWGSMNSKISLMRVRHEDAPAKGAQPWSVAGLQWESMLLHHKARTRPSIYIETLFVSYAWPVFVSAAVAILAFRRSNRKAPRLRICLVCGYDLRATPDRCPGCGTIPQASEGASK